MHNFDPDLIAALAEGTVAPAEAAAVEARIAADPNAAAELAAQRAALAAIRTARLPHLEEPERVALHAAVASQLGLTGSVAPAPRRRRRMNWGPIAVAATTLVAIVAFAPMLSDLGGERADDAATIGADAATTVAITEDGFEVAPLGTQIPAPTVSTDAGDEVFAGAGAATTTVPGMLGRAAYLPEVADDLALLKSDPEALTVLERPIDDTTACLVEATQFLGSAEVTTFDYPVANPDPTMAPTTYVVFRLPAPDGVGPGTLVAFDPADCATPIVVP